MDRQKQAIATMEALVLAQEKAAARIWGTIERVRERGTVTATTTMATSFENLKPGVKAAEKKKAGLDGDKDYTADADCLRCHTTGYGKPGGFTSIAETPDMANVQCEECHGAGGDFRTVMKNKNFKLAEATAAGLKLPNEKNNNCMDCHGSDSPFNEKVDPKYKFDIKDRLTKTHEHFPLKYEH